MNPTIDILTGLIVAAITGALKLIPSLKAQPWHNALIRLVAAVLSVGLVAGLAWQQGHLNTFDWPSVGPVIGDAFVAFLAATGWYTLATPKK